MSFKTRVCEEPHYCEEECSGNCVGHCLDILPITSYREFLLTIKGKCHLDMTSIQLENKDVKDGDSFSLYHNRVKKF